MYFLLKMGIFQPAMLVYQSVYEPFPHIWVGQKSSRYLGFLCQCGFLLHILRFTRVPGYLGTPNSHPSFLEKVYSPITHTIVVNENPCFQDYFTEKPSPVSVWLPRKRKKTNQTYSHNSFLGMVKFLPDVFIQKDVVGDLPNEMKSFCITSLVVFSLNSTQPLRQHEWIISRRKEGSG